MTDTSAKGALREKLVAILQFQQSHSRASNVGETIEHLDVDAMLPTINEALAAAFAQGAEQQREADARAIENIIPKLQLPQTERPTIEELEAILQEDTVEPIQMQPDGSVTVGTPDWVGWCSSAVRANPLPQPAQDWLDKRDVEQRLNGFKSGREVAEQDFDVAFTRKLADAEANAYRRCAEWMKELEVNECRGFLDPFSNWAEAAARKL